MAGCRIILDEAQNIKNKNTKCAKSVYELKALTRFCMSGTPMMNSVMELFSLICFLRIKPYCNADKFTSVYSSPTGIAYSLTSLRISFGL